MGLMEAGLAFGQGGGIVVDESFACPGVRGVWALGDALGGVGYAHGAFRQAATVVAAILGRPLPPMPPLPHVVYSAPEVAWVGAADGARVARVPFAALGRAHAAGDVDGLYKVVADDAGRVCGVHVIGAHATELLAAGCIAVARGLSLQELGSAPLPHPTWGEGLVEAAQLAMGAPLHLPPPLRQRS
jgi:dihydrolipoamide dehydrogenase